MNPRDELDEAAAERWAAEGHDPDTIEDWDPNDGGYRVAKVAIQGFMTTGSTGNMAHWEIDGKDASEREAVVTYGRDEISFSVSIKRGGTHAFTMADVDPDAAREIATALWQAAEELERRPTEDDP